MERLKFDDSGKLLSVDNSEPIEFDSPIVNKYLRTSESLEFLKQDDKKIEDIFSKDYWSLFEGEKRLEPLKFSNGKTQEDVVKEVVTLARQGHKVIFLHGTCGSGKSAIALNIARVLGSASVVVPVKTLQRQYEEDYITRKHLRKQNGMKMKIAMITGKDNHDSIFMPGVSCADPTLPENIKLTERNYKQLAEYAKENPFIRNASGLGIKDMRRMTVAPSNPYWSPILPADYVLRIFKDAEKRKYMGCNNREYIFYHRKKGCSYYDQQLAYTEADAIIFNSAKYKTELLIGRKPLTEVDIIDEADEFLDGFFQQEELNLTRLVSALKNIHPESLVARDSIDKIQELIELEWKNKKAIGIDENAVFHISETKIHDILKEFVSNSELEAEIELDELNYSNRALETAKNFEGAFDNVYMTFKKDDDNNLLVKLVSTNLSGKFRDLMSKTKTIVLMSGTLHSDTIIKNIFGIKDYKVVQAENLNFGSIEITMTGKEFDCKYSNFSSKKHSREDYLGALSACIDKVKKPVLIHVHAYQDLPNMIEKSNLFLNNLITSDDLKISQKNDRTGKIVSNFKDALSDTLFSTKCSRGVDFPGEVCNSIVFTKYPNPNVKDTFWKILKKTHPEFYWEFYRDKAYRNFLQRIYRALRSPDDHVRILSPDTRVLDAVRKLQNN